MYSNQKEVLTMQRNDYNWYTNSGSGKHNDHHNHQYQSSSNVARRSSNCSTTRYCSPKKHQQQQQQYYKGEEIVDYGYEDIDYGYNQDYGYNDYGYNNNQDYDNRYYTTNNSNERRYSERRFSDLTNGETKAPANVSCYYPEDDEIPPLTSLEVTPTSYTEYNSKSSSYNNQSYCSKQHEKMHSMPSQLKKPPPLGGYYQEEHLMPALTRKKSLSPKKKSTTTTPSRTTSTASSSTTTNGEPTTIEITPGVILPLRGLSETKKAIENDFFVPCECFACCDTIFCIMDASYVLCPTCLVVNPIDSVNGDNNHGVGLGFTMEELAKQQAESLRKNRLAGRW